MINQDLFSDQTRIIAAIEAMKMGRPVIMMDDLDRENEADLIVAAEKLTEETMAILIRECSGIVCLCLPELHLQKLNLPQMVPVNESRYGTAFTISIEAREGVTTGVSAHDRLVTIQTAIADNAKPEDLARPGHVFPLQANQGGVLARRGHTEGSVDLAILAGLKPAAVLCELMNSNGTMMRGDQVVAFSTQHNFPIVTIEDIVQYRSVLGLIPA